MMEIVSSIACGGCGALVMGLEQMEIE